MIVCEENVPECTPCLPVLSLSVDFDAGRVTELCIDHESV